MMTHMRQNTPVELGSVAVHAAKVNNDNREKCVSRYKVTIFRRRNKTETN